jgi:hypothetical protein
MRPPPSFTFELVLDLEEARVGGIGGRERFQALRPVRLGHDDSITALLVAADFTPDEIGAALEEVEHGGTLFIANIANIEKAAANAARSF